MSVPLAAAPRPLLPLWAAVLASVVAGVLLSTWPIPASAGGRWPSPPSCLRSSRLIGRRAWGAAAGRASPSVRRSSSSNLVFTARYLGPVPWLALSMLEALITAALRGADRAGLSLAASRPARAPAARLLVLPALVAGLWTLREQIVGSWPYGGFPWGRIGMTQANGPLADARVLGRRSRV